MSNLPDILQEIEDLVGLSAAIAIADAKGGTRAYIPAKISDNGHWLVATVGREKADKICAHFAVNGQGDRHLIPMAGNLATARKHNAIRKMVDENTPIDIIARTAGCHRRTVFRVASKEPQTLPLFDQEG